MTDKHNEEHSCQISRRQFLKYSGAGAAAASTVTVSLFPGTAAAQNVRARVQPYPRIKVAQLSDLKENQPLDFNYPDDNNGSSCMVVRTGVECGGGVGSKRDVVAFSQLCTHQGGPLNGQYKAVSEHRVLGPCPFHLSLFDVRRHGIIVSGQAYESLPQILLEVEGDDVYAVGIMGLLFGRNENVMA